MPLFTLAVELQPSEQPLGHSVLASQPVSQALGLSSLRQESPLTIHPSRHAPKGQPPPCQLPAFNWVLTSLYFTVSIIPLSLLSPSPSPFLEPISSLLFTAATTNTFFFFGGGVFQRVSTFSILRCEIHFDTGLEIEWNRQYAPICSSLSSPSLFSSPWLSLSLFSLLLTMFFLLQSMDPLSHLTVFYHLETILQGKGLLAPNYIFIMTVKKGHNLLLLFFRVLIY